MFHATVPPLGNYGKIPCQDTSNNFLVHLMDFNKLQLKEKGGGRLGACGADILKRFCSPTQGQQNGGNATLHAYLSFIPLQIRSSNMLTFLPGMQGHNLSLRFSWVLRRIIYLHDTLAIKFNS